jgi:hypothetical protein
MALVRRFKLCFNVIREICRSCLSERLWVFEYVSKVLLCYHLRFLSSFYNKIIIIIRWPYCLITRVNLQVSLNIRYFSICWETTGFPSMKLLDRASHYVLYTQNIKYFNCIFFLHFRFHGFDIDNHITNERRQNQKISPVKTTSWTKYSFLKPFTL